MTTTARPRPLPPLQDLLSSRAALAVGALGAVVTVTVAGLPGVGLALGCVGVVLLYAVYPVVSVRWGTPGERTAEAAFALVGAASIVLALSLDPRWLAAGWALHGLWDALHGHPDGRRHRAGLAGVPRWYVDACLVWDLVAAAGLLVVL